jgi:hypothetical protein
MESSAYARDMFLDCFALDPLFRPVYLLSRFARVNQNLTGLLAP